ncbi:MAG TPA: DUF932 domain-containing protein [Polyangiaceae bacterium]|nr:DUF932 domain-containing protein [Polyangiaceae bacterium]
MAANVQSMFSVRKTPWHRFGAVLDHAPSVNDAIRHAGLDWNVERVSLNKIHVPGLHFGPDHAAIVRTDTRDVLGIVGSRYTPVQNAAKFRFFDAVVESGRATMETAGALGRGEKVWILAKSVTAEVVPGDPVESYLLLAGSHDGTSAISVLPTGVRVVCQNTLGMALRGDAARFTIRHTASASRRLEDAGRMMAESEAAFGETIERWKHLARRKVNPEKFAKALIPDAPEGTSNTRRENARAAILDSYDSAPGANKARGSAWAAYNAATHWISHKRTTRKASQERLACATWLPGGSGTQLRDKAFKIALAMADGSTEYVTAAEAVSMVDDRAAMERKVGRELLSEMMAS